MICKREHRNLLRLTMALDPKIIPHLRTLIRMGVSNFRPDYMLLRDTETGTVTRLDDPGAWNGMIEPRPYTSFSLCLLRHRDGTWSIHS